MEGAIVTIQKSCRRLAITAALLVTAWCSSVATAADCTRAQLSATVTNYMKALSALNFHRLPLSRHAGYTENGKFLNFGEGFWKTAGAVKLKRSALDTH